jgi:hypothetical protein
MTPEETQHLQTIVMTLTQQVYELKASETAMHRLIAELMKIVPPDVALLIAKHPAYKREAWQDILLAVEKTQPGFAAQLDKHTPLISPSEPDEL